jgi:putative endonuclease
MHYLYVLYSPSKNKFYIGETSDVNFRLNLHNNHAFRGAYTKISNDWEVKLNFECSSKDKCLYLESFIKKMKSRKFIVKIIENPEILNDILSKK